MCEIKGCLITVLLFKSVLGLMLVFQYQACVVLRLNMFMVCVQGHTKDGAVERRADGFSLHGVQLLAHWTVPGVRVCQETERILGGKQ